MGGSDRAQTDSAQEIDAGLEELERGLARLAAGDPSVRLVEQVGASRLARLRKLLNQTAEYFEETVLLCHEFAMGLSEHFDVLSRLADGDLGARIEGSSSVELVQALSDLTNQTIISLEQANNQQRRAEQAVRQSESLLRLVLDSNPCCIAVKDRQGRYLLANSSLGKLYDLTPAALVGKTDQDLVRLGLLDVDECARRELEERTVLADGKMSMAPHDDCCCLTDESTTSRRCCCPLESWMLSRLVKTTC